MCSPAQMRRSPIGTGPFKFVEFKPNESIKIVRNPDYWKKDRPYLDAIEYTYMANPSTAILAFAAGNFDRFAQGILSLPLMKQLKEQAPNAVCEVVPWNIPRQLLVNPSKPPFDNTELRRAVGLALDRKAFIDIISDGEGSIGGAMMPPPAGSWGMPPEMLQPAPGYGPDVQKNRAEAREIMKKLGYGPDKRLAIEVTTRNTPAYRDPAVLLIDQLKEIYIDATLNAIDTAQWYPDRHAQGLHDRGDRQRERARRSGPAILREFRVRLRAQLHRLLQPRGRQADRPAIDARAIVDKRRQIVWEIERRLAEDGGAAGNLLPGLGGLLAALLQGPHDDGQRQLQRLASGGCLARPVGPYWPEIQAARRAGRANAPGPAIPA